MRSLNFATSFSSFSIFSVMPVLVKLGQTEFTRMPFLPRSSARPGRGSRRRPLPRCKGSCPQSPPVPETEAVLMMVPFVFSRYGIAARQPRHFGKKTNSAKSRTLAYAISSNTAAGVQQCLHRPDKRLLIDRLRKYDTSGPSRPHALRQPLTAVEKKRNPTSIERLSNRLRRLAA
jgi:hypothetical protein